MTFDKFLQLASHLEDRDLYLWKCSTLTGTAHRVPGFLNDNSNTNPVHEFNHDSTDMIA